MEFKYGFGTTRMKMILNLCERVRDNFVNNIDSTRFVFFLKQLDSFYGFE